MPKVNKVGVRKRYANSYQLRWKVDNKLYEKSVEAKSETQASEIRAKLVAETKYINFPTCSVIVKIDKAHNWVKDSNWREAGILGSPGQWILKNHKFSSNSFEID